MATLVLAEKPSVARDLAHVLGATSRAEGYLQGNGYVVTWAIGHLVALAEPQEMNRAWKRWSLADLPILPNAWPLVVSESTRAQYAIVRRWLLSSDVDDVVCATDAGREGELIFRYIYESAGASKPVRRLWISSLTPQAIRAGFASLQDGRAFDRLADAARARSRADWLVGMNLTRAYSVLNDDVLSVGRVQTPTLAMIVAAELQQPIRVTSGPAIQHAGDLASILSSLAEGEVLFLDEIHRFTKAQQDGLLSGVENRLVVLVAATTENPSFSVIAPLLSRSMLITLEPLSADELDDVLTAALSEQRGLGGVFTLEPEARQHVIRMAGGDARRVLTSLEAAAGVALDAQPAGRDSEEQILITLAQVEQAVAHAAVRYDRAGDQHYDVASALIKSMRGSDVDASLHYLARMLEAGEDPRFIARRIVIAASEDVGMADPTALQTAVAAMHAVAQIGMPEARIILAQAVVHNAIAPKSNSSYLGINEAIADIRAGRGGPVPVHLRGSGYAGAGRIGHGEGYRYAHDDPAGVVAQQYLPDDLLVGTDYFRPTDRGFEQTLSARWARLKELIRATS